MPVPNSFANVTTSIPLSQLDANFNTPITLGNTAIQLGNTVTTLNNMTLANVTISSGNVTITNVSVTTANVTTANIGTSIITTSETLNYGTANGVAYLNASKVLTTGTALVFDGTNLGIGTSSPATRLHVLGTSSEVARFIRDNTGSASGGITIGNNSRVFTIYGDSNALSFWDTTAAAQRMTLDASGNLGLGVTPSAWNTGWRALTLGSLANINSTDGWLQLLANAYYDVSGNYKYIASASTRATRYLQNGGVHSWEYSAAGTAGNNITFTQAMTLDASGNLGIGTTSPAQRLHLSGGTSTSLQISATGNASNGLRMGFASSSVDTYLSNTENGVLIFGTNNTERARIDSSGNLILGGTSQLNAALLTVTGNVNAEVSQSILNTNTGANANARLDIGASNYVNNELTLLAYSDAATGTLFGINKAKLKAIFDNVGVSSANSNGLLIGTSTSNPLYFGTNSTERVRIDASGFTQFNSNLVMPYQGAPTSKAAAATLTGAELVTGILNTTGTTYTITLPTGTNIEGALTWSANNVCLDWWVINTASGTITIGANGNTTLGTLTVATGVSAHFRIRRTAANTFTVYRLS